jgi:hypothetical protein
MSFLFQPKFTFILLFFLSFPLKAQTFKIKEPTDSIQSLFKTIGETNSDTEKIAYNKQITHIFKELLTSDASFEYSFDSLKNVGKPYAPDKSFRIINWNLPLSDGTHRYFCFIQTMDIKQKTVKLFELNDSSENIAKPEDRILNKDRWFGGLYYKILRNEIKGKAYYTLLALQYHNYFTTRKIIDVLSFDLGGDPQFGAPVFQADNKIKKRIIFEYSAKSGMNLKYDDKLQMIVFDHLAPRESKYIGLYEYYGPDLSFDGFKFQKDHWVLISNLDLRRPDQPHR